MARRQEVTWRPGPFLRLLSFATLVGTAIAAFVFAGVALAGTRTANNLPIAAIFALLAVFAWRTGVHPTIEATEQALIVRNPIRTYVIPWRDVVHCEATRHGIRIQRRSGKRVYGHAVGRPSVLENRELRADKVAQALNARRAHPPPDSR